MTDRQTERGENGASAVEYGLLIAGIAALIAAVVFVFGDLVNGTFTGTCEEVESASNPSAIVSC